MVVGINGTEASISCIVVCRLEYAAGIPRDRRSRARGTRGRGGKHNYTFSTHILVAGSFRGLPRFWPFCVTRVLARRLSGKAQKIRISQTRVVFGQRSDPLFVQRAAAVDMRSTHCGSSLRLASRVQGRRCPRLVMWFFAALEKGTGGA